MRVCDLCVQLHSVHGGRHFRQLPRQGTSSLLCSAICLHASFSATGSYALFCMHAQGFGSWAGAFIVGAMSNVYGIVRSQRPCIDCPAHCASSVCVRSPRCVSRGRSVVDISVDGAQPLLHRHARAGKVPTKPSAIAFIASRAGSVLWPMWCVFFLCSFGVRSVLANDSGGSVDFFSEFRVLLMRPRLLAHLCWLAGVSRVQLRW